LALASTKLVRGNSRLPMRKLNPISGEKAVFCDLSPPIDDFDFAITFVGALILA